MRDCVGLIKDHFGPVDGKPQHLLVVCVADSQLALDEDVYAQILRESGFLPTDPGGV